MKTPGIVFLCLIVACESTSLEPEALEARAAALEAKVSELLGVEERMPDTLDALPAWLREIDAAADLPPHEITGRHRGLSRAVIRGAI